MPFTSPVSNDNVVEAASFGGIKVFVIFNIGH